MMDTALPAIDLAHILADILPTAGVGGALALLMFYFYRKDADMNAGRMADLCQRWEGLSSRSIDALNHNTEALTRLAERLK